MTKNWFSRKLASKRRRSYNRVKGLARTILREAKGEILETVHHTRTYCYRLRRATDTQFFIERRRQILDFPCRLNAWRIYGEYSSPKEANSAFCFISVYY